MKTLSQRLALLSLFLLTGIARADDKEKAAWWDKEWTIRKPMVVDTAAADAAVSDPVGGAPVLVRLHDGTFQFTSAKDDGSDIRFVAEDGKTLLPYHVEKYDGLLNEAFVWVRVPDVKPGGKTNFTLYYGNLEGAKATNVMDAKGTFDPDTVLAYHFGGSGPTSDISGNSNNASNAVTPVEGSLIGGGVRFDGKATLNVPASPSLQWSGGGAMTWSAWVKPAALAPGVAVFARREGSNALVVGLDNGVPFVEVNGQRSATGAALPVNTWHHLAAVASPGKVELFVDGAPAGSVAAGLPALNSPLVLGGDAAADAGGTLAAFSGEMDEVQISKVARTPGFLKFAAFSQGTEKADKLVTLGTDEQGEGGGDDHSGHFAIIIKNLTVDAWVVIILCAFMAVGSWFIMWSKVAYLNAMAKGNELFMKAWAGLSSDLTALDPNDADQVKTLGGHADKKSLKHLRKSSVYRIYQVGSEEIRHRMAREHSSGALSGRSMEAIRAALDGTQVREKQKIDKLIVLLTICISGGPFLGLLGTVVGVMITFAAVAAAGDVNVNAIAPGIAAALLATVAGLAVAIPALFGYNYILARAKDATADMHVFIEEFIAKMAEFYSGESKPAPSAPRYANSSNQPAAPVLAPASV